MRCRYCMPAEGIPKLCHEDILSLEDLYRVARAAVALGIEKVRVTGGEPLVRKGILELLGRLSAIPGLKQLVMTTNGMLLEKMAGDLRAAGVQRLNVSLDSLRPDTFSAVTRGADLGRVLAGIAAAEQAGFPAQDQRGGHAGGQRCRDPRFCRHDPGEALRGSLHRVHADDEIAQLAENGHLRGGDSGPHRQTLSLPSHRCRTNWPAPPGRSASTAPREPSGSSPPSPATSARAATASGSPLRARPADASSPKPASTCGPISSTGTSRSPKPWSGWSA